MPCRRQESSLEKRTLDRTACGGRLMDSGGLLEGKESMSVLERDQQDGGQVLATEAVPQNKVGITRREFVHTTLAAGLALGAAPGSWAAETKGEIPYRTLGRTGEKVSAIGLGGFHIGVPPEAQG